ncbi:hypothetical protein F9868_03440 [Glaesserella parasuis]|nr:hypothetical protein [Glaesserella parasuis]
MDHRSPCLRGELPKAEGGKFHSLSNPPFRLRHVIPSAHPSGRWQSQRSNALAFVPRKRGKGMYRIINVQIYFTFPANNCKLNTNRNTAITGCRKINGA